MLDGVRPKIYGSGKNVRDWVHVFDHNRAVHTILAKGRIGETYLIGADCELDNLTVVGHILRILGKPDDWFDLVSERPGHDLRYAIDPTKLRDELGWRSEYGDFVHGLEQTVRWYQENEAWWRPKKAETEQRYLAMGR